jgi:hypothetical protein
MTRTDGFPSFVEAVVGRPVRGSWWAHEQSGPIFSLAEAIHDSNEVLSLKLIQGKVTFVHESLWPALARIVTDPEWREARRRKLSSDAARLLGSVERKGSVRLDPAHLKVGKELEPTLLVHSGSVHTEKGSHATLLSAWKRVFDADAMARSRKLSLDDAKSQLRMNV